MCAKCSYPKLNLVAAMQEDFNPICFEATAECSMSSDSRNQLESLKHLLNAGYQVPRIDLPKGTLVERNIQ
jgi:hypothetical protein